MHSKAVGMLFCVALGCSHESMTVRDPSSGRDLMVVRSTFQNHEGPRAHPATVPLPVIETLLSGRLREMAFASNTIVAKLAQAMPNEGVCIGFELVRDCFYVVGDVVYQVHFAGRRFEDGYVVEAQVKLDGTPVAQPTDPSAPDAPAGVVACSNDMQCKGDRICVSGKCVSPDEIPTADGCKTDAECKGDRVCEHGRCTSATP